MGAAARCSPAAEHRAAGEGRPPVCPDSTISKERHLWSEWRPGPTEDTHPPPQDMAQGAVRVQPEGRARLPAVLACRPDCRRPAARGRPEKAPELLQPARPEPFPDRCGRLALGQRMGVREGAATACAPDQYTSPDEFGGRMELTEGGDFTPPREEKVGDWRIRYFRTSD